jgi:hypothetical protein
VFFTYLKTRDSRPCEGVCASRGPGVELVMEIRAHRSLRSLPLFESGEIVIDKVGGICVG